MTGNEREYRAIGIKLESCKPTAECTSDTKKKKTSGKLKPGWLGVGVGSLGCVGGGVCGLFGGNMPRHFIL